LAEGAIAMQTGEPIVDSEVGEQYSQKADDGKDGDTVAAPAAHHAQVQHGRIDEPRDQRPGLFRIPTPITRPGLLGPHRAGDNTAVKNRKPNITS